MAKTLSSKAWAHYVRAAKENGYASIFEAYGRPSHDKIMAWRNLSNKCSYARIVSKSTFNFTVLRRVHVSGVVMYNIVTRDNSYTISRLDLLEALNKEHEKELILYIIDVEKISQPLDEAFGFRN
jgi:hypothetical protein